MKHLLRIADLSRDDLIQLTELAQYFHSDRREKQSALSGKTAVMYFARPSPGMRLAFASALTRLGGVPLSLGTAELTLGKEEPIEDTARAMSDLTSAIVIGTFADSDVERVAAAASVPVMNAVTDGHHPCQALADLVTLRRHFGRFEGLRIAYVGAGNNIAHSLIEACAIAGINIIVATPEGYQPDPSIVAAAQARAQANGSSIVITDDPSEAVSGADAIYTSAWVTDADHDTQHRRQKDLAPYRVDTKLLQKATPAAVFLHPLPAHRGDEVTAEVMDGPRSLVFQQAASRLPAAQAVLHTLLGRGLTGVPPSQTINPPSTKPVDTAASRA